MATWNELLRQARAGTGLSRQALAELAGLSEGTIYSYEAGRRPPQRQTVLRLTWGMNLDGSTTNAILEAAGLAPERSPWRVSANLRIYLEHIERRIQRRNRRQRVASRAATRTRPRGRGGR